VGTGNFKLTDAITRLMRKVGRRETGRPSPTHATAADQARESQESRDARYAEASIRARMVTMGRGNQQAGRQGQ
jgi:hypothetical protein